jgi:hypothetical protein
VTGVPAAGTRQLNASRIWLGGRHGVDYSVRIEKERRDQTRDAFHRVTPHLTTILWRLRVRKHSGEDEENHHGY